MKVGFLYAHNDEQKERLLRIISRIDNATTPIGSESDCWIKVPGKGEPQLTMGMMQGMGIQSTIKEFKIPMVSHVAVTMAGAPYGLYGIRGHYEKGTQRVELWVMDSGCGITPVLAKVYDKEQEQVIA